MNELAYITSEIEQCGKLCGLNKIFYFVAP
jgi:hypothetical protein